MCVCVCACVRVCVCVFALSHTHARPCTPSPVCRDLATVTKDKADKTSKELTRLYARRVACNFGNLLIVGGFLFSIYYLSQVYADSTDVWEQLAAPLLSTLGSSLLPTFVYVSAAVCVCVCVSVSVCMCLCVCMQSPN